MKKTEFKLKQITPFVFIMLLWLIQLPTVDCQKPDYKIKYYSIPEGLSNRIVYDVFQDPKGFIWLTVEEGINRFDGYEFINLSDKKSHPRIELSKSDFSQIHKLGNEHFIIEYQNHKDFFDLVQADKLLLYPVDLKMVLPSQNVVGFVPMPNSEEIAICCRQKDSLIFYSFNPIHKKLEFIAKYDLTPYSIPETLNNVQLTINSKGFMFFSASLAPTLCFNLKEHSVHKLDLPVLEDGYLIFKNINDQEIYYTSKNKSGIWAYNYLCNTNLLIKSTSTLKRLNHI